ncbi:MAG: (Fe-S)-binding protein [Terriglobales bacterium]
MSATITAGKGSNFTTPDRPTWDLYSSCIHCGLCLQQCPTYRVLGREADSPRGRLYQILQVDAGNLEIGDSFVTHLDRCLGCRACETACPSGVHYGAILERARAEIETHYRRPWLGRKIRDYFYRKVLNSNSRLAMQARLLRFYQKSGLQAFARGTGLLKFVGMEKLEALAPAIDDKFYFDELGKTYPAIGEKRGRVAFLAGCIASVSFAELNRATVRVLNENGIEVYVPGAQGCCGALAAHGGYREEARKLARKNIDAMLDPSCDAIVTNAAGCGATLKEYGDLLGDDPAYGTRAHEFAAKSKDVNEYLASIGLRAPKKKLAARVTYQDPCHLAHGQGVRSAPRELLQAAGMQLVELAHPDFCCGSAGTYNVVQNELSMKILADKMDDVASTPADVLATANVGCMLQLRAGVKQRGLNMRVVHVIELLDEAYGSPSNK